MVNERLNGCSPIVVNSASLEDVAQSEISDTRAHSVSSIHTTSDPNTPTYEDLQSKLETSNRNIQNIREQQQQLIRLQQAAKQQLKDMENVRKHGKYSNTAHLNHDGTPEYESVEQVHDDMANLVNRMKNLTTFIQGQHEFSALLGEDGPEILAEQEVLQRKLEELKAQKHDIKNIVSELQEINNSAERAVQQQSKQQDEPRVVPVEYQRVVPIELTGSVSKIQNGISLQQKPIQNGNYQNGLASNSDVSDETNNEESIENENSETLAETTDLIRQKMADINAMKNQLKRLKDMMEAVKLIEEKTEGRSVKDVGNDSDTIESLLTSSQQKLLNQDNASPTISSSVVGRDEVDQDLSVIDTSTKEEEMSEKVRLLHEMTQDLREQARQMSSERDRLRALKEEIKKRRQFSEKNSTRENSVPKSNNVSSETEKQILEAEYEAKKKEFEKLCQRLNEEDVIDVRSEAQEDELEEPESKHHFNRNSNWRRSDVASIAPSNHSCKGQSEAGLTPLRGKDSADSGAVDVHGHPSIEAASFKSESSRSYSVPPPMRAINNREMPWRKNSQDNENSSSSQFNHFIPPSQVASQHHPGMPLIWNPSSYYYSTPYAQQCSPQFHSGGGEYCLHQCHSNANSQQNSINSTSNDPVLLQQFIQTQQMLINSVSQCNHLLWNQQREINSLNNAVLMLQERLLNSSDVNLTRPESVPNPIASSFCSGINRAQSEQPQPCGQQSQPPLSPINRPHQVAQNYNNIFHQRRNIMNLQQQHQQHQQLYNQTNHFFGGGNSSSNTSYNNFSSVAATEQQNFLNNDVSTSGANIHGGPPPIFMHHHNNTINPQNNSNLLNSHQNCLNSPSSTAAAAIQNNINPVSNTSSNAAAAAAALNNQVPPGNRANNYWDNFRSYSRQNLLSSNSCKSNEEQNHLHHQQQLQQQQQQQQQQPQQQPLNEQSSSTLFGTNFSINQNSNGVRNLNQQQQYQQHHQQQQGNNWSSNSGNFASIDSNKYVYTFRNQFNNINGLEQSNGNLFNQSQQQHNHNSSNITRETTVTAIIPPTTTTTAPPNNTENFLQQQQQERPTTNFVNSSYYYDERLNEVNNFNINNANNINNSNNNLSNNVAAIFDSPNFRNMNFNFGNHDMQKKIPHKTPCSSSIKRPRNISPTSSLSNNNNNTNNRIHHGQNQICDNSMISHQQQSINISESSKENETDDNGAVGGYNNYQDIPNDIPEEMKRNLLVNALKNDKFTKKFFESLREDVYREVYSIIQQTETNPQYLLQLFKELQYVSSIDPLRNVVMQAMDDLYKRSYSNSVGSETAKASASASSNSNITIEGEDDDNNGDENNENEFANHQKFNQKQKRQKQQEKKSHNHNDSNSNQTQQSRISNETSSLNNISIEGNTISKGEDNRQNEIIINGLIDSQDLKRLAYKILFESILTSSSPAAQPAASTTEVKKILPNLDKDKKLGLKYNKMITARKNSLKIPNEVYRPDYELINYIMSKIRYNLNVINLIDDEVINRIAQITIQALENYPKTLSSSLPICTEMQQIENLITNRELYRRMKTFELNDLENFLARYEAYLQTIFVMKITNENNYDGTFVNNVNNHLVTMNNNEFEDEKSTNEVQSSSNINISINNNNNVQKISRINQKSNIPLLNECSNSNTNDIRDNNSGNNDRKSPTENIPSSENINYDNIQQNISIANDISVDQQQQMEINNVPNASIFPTCHYPHHSSSDISLNIVDTPTSTSTCVSASSVIIMNNSNNIANDDLAEADQICSSSVISENISSSQHQQQRHQQQHQHKQKQKSFSQSHNNRRQCHYKNPNNSIVVNSVHNGINQNNSSNNNDDETDNIDNIDGIFQNLNTNYCMSSSSIIQMNKQKRIADGIVRGLQMDETESEEEQEECIVIKEEPEDDSDNIIINNNKIDNSDVSYDEKTERIITSPAEIAAAVLQFAKIRYGCTSPDSSTKQKKKYFNYVSSDGDGKNGSCNGSFDGNDNDLDCNNDGGNGSENNGSDGAAAFGGGGFF